MLLAILLVSIPWVLCEDKDTSLQPRKDLNLVTWLFFELDDSSLNTGQNQKHSILQILHNETQVILNSSHAKVSIRFEIFWVFFNRKPPIVVSCSCEIEKWNKTFRIELGGIFSLVLYFIRLNNIQLLKFETSRGEDHIGNLQYSKNSKVKRLQISGKDKQQC